MTTKHLDNEIEEMLKLTDPRSSFDIFANEMYQNNCVEREAYGDPILTYDEYIEKNMQFLLDNLPQDVV